MHVREVNLTNFMRHDQADLVIPSKGIVLVTGTNGSGKSTFNEAVAWCYWGQTLRGSKPWRPKQECRVKSESDRVWVERRRTAGGRISLTWGYLGEGAEDYDTPTKAQEALDAVVGSFDTWRKTHVLTSADAAGFTQAKDADRKRMVEDLLGIENLDAARAAARDAYRDATSDVAACNAYIGAAEEAKLRAQKTLQELQEPDPLVAAPDESHVRSTQRMLKEAKNESILIGRARSEAFSEKATHASNHQHAARRLERVEAGECPTCTQEVPSILVSAFRAQAQKELRAADAAAKEADRVAAEAAADQEELAEEAEGLQDILRDIRGKKELAAERERAHRTYRTYRSGAQKTIEESDSSLAHYEAQRGKAEASADVLKTVRAVFGMKGFRAQVLGDALGGMQHLANTWLQMLSDGVSLELTTDDKGNISINVDGYSGGEGYRGSSTGERRRIDVALLLALADVAASVRGAEGGTLFLDEVFDGLDGSGVDGVCSVLSALAEDRGIVVITHNPALRGMVEAHSHIEL